MTRIAGNRIRLFLLPIVCCLPAGCQQQMAKQPKYRPLERSAFFGDERSARPLLADTVARGHPRADQHLFAGKRGPNEEWLYRVPAMVGAANPLLILGPAGADASYVDSFPFPITETILERGRQRFDIFCSVCHDRLGTGNGKVVQRGFTRPPSLTAPIRENGILKDDLSRGFKLRGIEWPIRTAPLGYYFEVITHGFGAMPDYAAQVPPRDRWAIIAYLRTLQWSQRVDLKELPLEEQRKALEKLEANRGGGK